MRISKKTFRLASAAAILSLVLQPIFSTAAYALINDNDGPHGASQIVDNGGTGTFSWANASRAQTSNGSWATSTISNSSSPTHYLKATGFGFNIPANASIDGVIATIERHESCDELFGCTSHITDNIVKLVKGGSVTGNNKASSQNWTSNDSTASYGSSSDIWGISSLTPADINDSSFGLVLSAKRNNGGDRIASVDYMSLKVFYSIDEKPVISTHSAVIAEATSAEGATVSYVSPDAIDDIDGTQPAICSPASDSLFPLGITSVKCDKTDTAGNAADSTYFDVTVLDTTAPIITLTGAADMTVEYGTSYTEQGATWSDTVDGTGSAAVSGDIVDTDTLGDYVVKYSYTDNAGNSAAEVTRTVHVTDTTAPATNFNISGGTTGSGDWYIGGVAPTVILSTEDGSNIFWRWDDEDFASGATTQSPVVSDGTHTLEYYAVDPSSNEESPHQTKIVKYDSEAPILIGAGDEVMDIEYGNPYDEPGAAWIDNLDGMGEVIAISGDVVDTKKLGTYHISYDYTDAAGNTAEQIVRTVNIIPRKITVTADNKTKVEGAKDPSLTYKITSGSLVDGDKFTGKLTRANGEAADKYQIQQGTLSLGDNYEITFKPGVMTINKKPVVAPVANNINTQIAMDTSTATDVNSNNGEVLGGQTENNNQNNNTDQVTDTKKSDNWFTNTLFGVYYWIWLVAVGAGAGGWWYFSRRSSSN